MSILHTGIGKIISGYPLKDKNGDNTGSFGTYVEITFTFPKSDNLTANAFSARIHEGRCYKDYGGVADENIVYEPVTPFDEGTKTGGKVIDDYTPSIQITCIPIQLKLCLTVTGCHLCPSTNYHAMEVYDAQLARTQLLSIPCSKCMRANFGLCGHHTVLRRLESV